MNQPLKPREKANRVGLSNTQDYELVSILLGTGTKKYPVTTLAKKILHHQPLHTWQFSKTDDFKKIFGCGPVKSIQLTSCVELGRRIFTPPTQPTIQNSQDVHAQVMYLAKRQREEVVCLYLNARNELLKKETVAVGGLNYSNIHPRDVFSTALTLPCANIILVHNHPSGNVNPSKEDIRVTHILESAGTLLGIRLLDHLIVGDQKIQSLAEIGLLSG